MRPGKNARLLQVSREQEVSAYFPPAYAVELAQSRIDGLLRYFWEAQRGASWLQAMDYIESLARSAYLQGVNDAAIGMLKLEEQKKGNL